LTPTETALFLNQVMALTLSPDEIAALEARTEGWITARPAISGPEPV